MMQLRLRFRPETWICRIAVLTPRCAGDGNPIPEGRRATELTEVIALLKAAGANERLCAALSGTGPIYVVESAVRSRIAIDRKLGNVSVFLRIVGPFELEP